MYNTTIYIDTNRLTFRQDHFINVPIDQDLSVHGHIGDLSYSFLIYMK